MSERWSVEHGMCVRRVGAGPELVWIHGLGEWSVNFDPLARRPELAAWTHVLVDLPGYGRSPRADLPALDDVAGALAAWLAERPPAVLVGHSMGGVLATLVAERQRVRAVVDVDGNLTRGDCTFSAQAEAYTADEFAAAGFARMRDDVYRRGLDDAALRGYHAAMCATSPAAFHRHSVDLVRLSIGETLAPRLGALQVPVLFVAGVPGGVCEHSRALLDRHGVRWIAIEPSGHWVHVDRPDAFTAALAQFVGEL
ncbi:MAG: alpha/beta hydrolase [Deltaproteobacteria bacterium]|nr:alpha/beta hydrolase [Deltaproteobacteria bacterium]